MNHFQAYKLKSVNTLKKMVDKAQKRVGELPSVDSVLMFFFFFFGHVYRVAQCFGVHIKGGVRFELVTFASINVVLPIELSLGDEIFT